MADEKPCEWMMVAALKFYADRHNWSFVFPSDRKLSEVEMDGGGRAREALNSSFSQLSARDLAFYEQGVNFGMKSMSTALSVSKFGDDAVNLLRRAVSEIYLDSGGNPELVREIKTFLASVGASAE